MTRPSSRGWRERARVRARARERKELIREIRAGALGARAGKKFEVEREE